MRQRTARLVEKLSEAFFRADDSSEPEIEKLLPILRHAPEAAIALQADLLARRYLAMKGRCVCCNPKLVRMRLRRMAQALDELNEIKEKLRWQTTTR